MSTEGQSARELTIQLQQLFQAHRDGLMGKAEGLLQGLAKNRRGLPRLVFVSLGQRMFLLLRDIADTFEEKVESGYHTSATLTRGLMETATTVLILERDEYRGRLAAFARSAEAEAEKRKSGLAKLASHPRSEVAAAAQKETKQAQQVVAALQAIQRGAQLTGGKQDFPNMHERCRILGDLWEFMYHAAYRELSEAVHGGFSKIPHSPSLAFRSPDQGAALLYEHCRATCHAFEFWGMTVVELTEKHPDQAATTAFRDDLHRVVEAAANVMARLVAVTQPHTITF